MSWHHNSFLKHGIFFIRSKLFFKVTHRLGFSNLINCLFSIHIFWDLCRKKRRPFIYYPFLLKLSWKKICAMIIQCFDASLTTSHPIWYCISRAYLYMVRKLITLKGWWCLKRKSKARRYFNKANAQSLKLQVKTHKDAPLHCVKPTTKQKTSALLVQ